MRPEEMTRQDMGSMWMSVSWTMMTRDRCRRKMRKEWEL
jgi:hypothetical protein